MFPPSNLSLEQLNRENRMLQNSLESLPISLITFKESGEILFTNKKATRLLRDNLMEPANLSPDTSAHPFTSIFQIFHGSQIRDAITRTKQNITWKGILHLHQPSSINHQPKRPNYNYQSNQELPVRVTLTGTRMTHESAQPLCSPPKTLPPIHSPHSTMDIRNTLNSEPFHQSSDSKPRSPSDRFANILHRDDDTPNRSPPPTESRSHSHIHHHQPQTPPENVESFFLFSCIIKEVSKKPSPSPPNLPTFNENLHLPRPTNEKLHEQLPHHFQSFSHLPPPKSAPNNPPNSTMNRHQSESMLFQSILSKVPIGMTLWSSIPAPPAPNASGPKVHYKLIAANQTACELTGIDLRPGSLLHETIDLNSNVLVVAFLETILTSRETLHHPQFTVGFGTFSLTGFPVDQNQIGMVFEAHYPPDEKLFRSQMSWLMRTPSLPFCTLFVEHSNMNHLNHRYHHLMPHSPISGFFISYANSAFQALSERGLSDLIHRPLDQLLERIGAETTLQTQTNPHRSSDPLISHELLSDLDSGKLCSFLVQFRPRNSSSRSSAESSIMNFVLLQGPKELSKTNYLMILLPPSPSESERLSPTNQNTPNSDLNRNNSLGNDENQLFQELFSCFGECGMVWKCSSTTEEKKQEPIQLPPPGLKSTANSFTLVAQTKKAKELLDSLFPCWNDEPQIPTSASEPSQRNLRHSPPSSNSTQKSDRTKIFRQVFPQLVQSDGVEELFQWVLETGKPQSVKFAFRSIHSLQGEKGECFHLDRVYPVVHPSGGKFLFSVFERSCDPSREFDSPRVNSNFSEFQISSSQSSNFETPPSSNSRLSNLQNLHSSPNPHLNKNLIDSRLMTLCPGRLDNDDKNVIRPNSISSILEPQPASPAQMTGKRRAIRGGKSSTPNHLPVVSGTEGSSNQNQPAHDFSSQFALFSRDFHLSDSNQNPLFSGGESLHDLRIFAGLGDPFSRTRLTQKRFRSGAGEMSAAFQIDRFLLDNSLFKEIVDYSFVGIALLDQDHVIRFANSTLCHLLGFRRRELINTPLNVLLEYESEVKYLNQLIHQMNSKGTYHFTVSLQFRGGAGIRWISKFRSLFHPPSLIVFYVQHPKPEITS